MDPNVDSPEHPRQPTPVPTTLTQPFWSSCLRRELVVQQCQDCLLRWFPPDVACIHCFGSKWEWVPSRGEGVVYSYTVVHRPAGPGFSAPYVLAIVDLDDGWQMLTNIIGCRPTMVHIGLRVHVDFRSVTPEVSLPYFAPIHQENCDGHEVLG